MQKPSHIVSFACTALTAAAFVAVTGDVFAQTNRAPAPRQAAPNWYIGGGIGNSKIKQFNDTFLNVPAPSTGGGLYEIDRTSPSYKVFGGMMLHPNIGMELGYMSLGTFGARRDATAPAGTLSARVQTGGLYFDVVGWAPLAERFALFAKIGYLASTTKITGNSTITGVVAPTTKRSEMNLKYGLGAQFNYNREVAFRAEWERVTNVGNKNHYGFETNVEAITASMLYRF
jgi:OmpA-like transmembrane domain